MKRPSPVNTNHYLFMYDDRLFSRLTRLCKEIKDWDSILEDLFEIPFTTTAIPTERFMSCGHCGHHESIRLKLDSRRFPTWRCNSLCHSSLQDNIISLLCLFTDKSPLEVLDVLENKYIPDIAAARKVAPVSPKKVSPKKTKAVPAKKGKGTAPKSSRIDSIAGAIFKTH